VAGAAGVPSVTAPWWTRRLQRRLGSSRALAGLLAAEGAATLVVPAAATCGLLSPAVMIASGLAVGLLNALSGPLDGALLAGLGDARDRQHGAASVLALQETSVRVAMTVAPLAAFSMIALVGAAATVALEGVLSLVGAALIATMIVRSHDVSAEEAPRVRGLLRRHPEIRSGWLVRGVGCAAWFAFPLGLAVLGERAGQGAMLAAVGLTAYSGAAVVGSAGGILAARAARPALLNCAAWLVAGMGWIVIGLHPTAPVVGAVAAAAGLVVPAGNAATTAMVTRVTSGLERRAALTAQGTVVTGSSTMGSLVGGPLIAWQGPQAAIFGAGVMVTVLSAAVGWASLARKRDDEACPDGRIDVPDGSTDRFREPAGQGQPEAGAGAVRVPGTGAEDVVVRDHSEPGPVVLDDDPDVVGVVIGADADARVLVAHRVVEDRRHDPRDR
jgi:hypothetical protein